MVVPRTLYLLRNRREDLSRQPRIQTPTKTIFKSVCILWEHKPGIPTHKKLSICVATECLPDQFEDDTIYS